MRRRLGYNLPLLTRTDTMTLPAPMRAAVDEAKARVATLHAELPRWELVAWTAGNVSERVAGVDGHGDLFVIKPSGVSYDELDAGGMLF